MKDGPPGGHFAPYRGDGIPDPRTFLARPTSSRRALGSRLCPFRVTRRVPAPCGCLTLGASRGPTSEVDLPLPLFPSKLKVKVICVSVSPYVSFPSWGPVVYTWSGDLRGSDLGSSDLQDTCRRLDRRGESGPPVAPVDWTVGSGPCY